MGTGSFLPKAKAKRLLQQRTNTTLAKDRYKVIDTYFSIWTNQYPYQLVSYPTPLDQKSDWSSEEVINQRWSIVFRNMVSKKVLAALNSCSCCSFFRFLILSLSFTHDDSWTQQTDCIQHSSPTLR